MAAPCQLHAIVRRQLPCECDRGHRASRRGECPESLSNLASRDGPVHCAGGPTTIFGGTMRTTLLLHGAFVSAVSIVGIIAILIGL
jgi:hypothetical protein